MEYWNGVMHDDVFLVMNDGWLEAAKPRKAIEEKDRKLTETPDLVVGSGHSAIKYKMDLIPPAFIIARYFATEEAKIDELTATAEEAGRAIEEYVEENSSEDGLLAEAMDDGKIAKAQTVARLKDAKKEGSDPEEVAALEHLLKLYERESAAKRVAKEAQAALGRATLKKYGNLIEDEVKTLVLDDKWLATITSRITSAVEALTLTLVARIQELGERYNETVATLEAQLEMFEATVTRHLADMGIK